MIRQQYWFDNNRLYAATKILADFLEMSIHVKRTLCAITMCRFVTTIFVENKIIAHNELVSFLNEFEMFNIIAGDIQSGHNFDKLCEYENMCLDQQDSVLSLMQGQYLNKVHVKEIKSTYHFSKVEWLGENVWAMKINTKNYNSVLDGIEFFRQVVCKQSVTGLTNHDRFSYCKRLPLLASFVRRQASLLCSMFQTANLRHHNTISYALRNGIDENGKLNAGILPANFNPINSFWENSLNLVCAIKNAMGSAYIGECMEKGFV